MQPRFSSQLSGTGGKVFCGWIVAALSGYGWLWMSGLCNKGEAMDGWRKTDGKTTVGRESAKKRLASKRRNILA